MTSDALTKPRLYLVGAPKAGSSALGHFLAQHPQISLCRIKEPNFHCRDLDMPGPKTEAEYLGLFDPTPETKFLMDGSILSLYSHTAAASIAQYVDNAKILMILRNPVEAMYSWHGQMVFTANEPIQNFAAALDAEADRKQGQRLPSAGVSSCCPQLLFYRDMMRYAEQLQRYRDVFVPEQIHVVLYDDFKADPATVYRKILDFLELEEFHPEFNPINPPKVRRNWRLHLWLKRLFAAPTRALLSAEFRLRLINWLDRINSKPQGREALAPELAAQLKAQCRPDIIKLGAMLNRDLTHWYT
jgi:hypothetical protein